MNREWLLAHAQAPIRYNLTRDASLIEDVLKNDEVRQWMGRLSDRAIRQDLSDIHGSHDYRYENIIGKCYVLGLGAEMPAFDAIARFFLGALDRQVSRTNDGPLTFGKMYQFRDQETLLACYLPFLGYAREPCVAQVARKRARIIHAFTAQGRYDVYRSDLAYPGAKREWKPYILDPALYEDGNIALPSIHDLILFAGTYPYLDEMARDQVETTVRWIFGDGYASINECLYYYAPDDPSYKSKGINNKVHLHDLSASDPKAMQGLLFHVFIFSHFRAARASKWFAGALKYLDGYKTASGRYVFPRAMIAEQKDSYLFSGGHMNVGEATRSRDYAEILSTYWMERIRANLR